MMKRHLLAIGVGALFPLIGVTVVMFATAAEAATLGVQRLVHR